MLIPIQDQSPVELPADESLHHSPPPSIRLQPIVSVYPRTPSPASEIEKAITANSHHAPDLVDGSKEATDVLQPVQAPAEKSNEGLICGMREKSLWVVIVLAFLLISIAIGSGVGAALSSKTKQNTTEKSELTVAAVPAGVTKVVTPDATQTEHSFTAPPPKPTATEDGGPVTRYTGTMLAYPLETGSWKAKGKLQNFDGICFGNDTRGIGHCVDPIEFPFSLKDFGDRKYRVSNTYWGFDQYMSIPKDSKDYYKVNMTYSDPVQFKFGKCEVWETVSVLLGPDPFAFNIVFSFYSPNICKLNNGAKSLPNQSCTCWWTGSFKDNEKGDRDRE